MYRFLMTQAFFSTTAIAKRSCPSSLIFSFNPTVKLNASEQRLALSQNAKYVAKNWDKKNTLFAGMPSPSLLNPKYFEGSPTMSAALIAAFADHFEPRQLVVPTMTRYAFHYSIAMMMTRLQIPQVQDALNLKKRIDWLLSQNNAKLLQAASTFDAKEINSMLPTSLDFHAEAKTNFANQMQKVLDDKIANGNFNPDAYSTDPQQMVTELIFRKELQIKWFVLCQKILLPLLEREIQLLLAEEKQLAAITTQIKPVHQLFCGASSTGKSQLVAESRKSDPNRVFVLPDWLKQLLKENSADRHESSYFQDESVLLNDLIKLLLSAYNRILGIPAVTFEIIAPYANILRFLKSLGGSIEINLTHCNLDTALTRNQKRSQQEERYVPSPIVLETFQRATDMTLALNDQDYSQDVTLSVFDSTERFPATKLFQDIFKIDYSNRKIVIYDVAKLFAFLDKKFLGSDLANGQTAKLEHSRTAAELTALFMQYYGQFDLEFHAKTHDGSNNSLCYAQYNARNKQLNIICGKTYDLIRDHEPHVHELFNTLLLSNNSLQAISGTSYVPSYNLSQ